jgi:hypothetical protein
VLALLKASKVQLHHYPIRIYSIYIALDEKPGYQVKKVCRIFSPSLLWELCLMYAAQLSCASAIATMNRLFALCPFLQVCALGYTSRATVNSFRLPLDGGMSCRFLIGRPLGEISFALRPMKSASHLIFCDLGSPRLVEGI